MISSSIANGIEILTMKSRDLIFSIAPSPPEEELDDGRKMGRFYMVVSLPVVYCPLFHHPSLPRVLPKLTQPACNDSIEDVKWLHHRKPPQQFFFLKKPCNRNHKS